LKRELGPQLPNEGRPLTDLLSDFQRRILPGIVHWGHPRFFGYFGSTTTAPGIIGETAAAALNVSAMTWRTSPAATELESLVLEWIQSAIGIPNAFRGFVYDTASVGTLHALAAARERAIPDARRKGLAGRALPVFRIYASEEAHSSIAKTAVVLGLGEDNVCRVAVSRDYQLDLQALREAVRADEANGFRPLAVVGTIGSTSCASVDPIKSLADLCEERELWLHVDAAYGGAMGLLPEGAWAMDGIERADSIVFNPHKWLFVPLDFSTLYVRDPDLLKSVFSLTPEYLEGDASMGETNYMDYGLQLGRRFRALKAWMVLAGFGKEGLVARVREHRRLAQRFASWIDEDSSFRRLAPVTMGVVCFQSAPASIYAQGEAALNAFNRRVVEQLNEQGKIFLTWTRLSGRTAMRLALGNVLTTEAHLREAWEEIRRLVRLLSAG
jgi:aromatic-L-amino-acid decarboxylase